MNVGISWFREQVRENVCLGAMVMYTPCKVVQDTSC